MKAFLERLHQLRCSKHVLLCYQEEAQKSKVSWSSKYMDTQIISKTPFEQKINCSWHSSSSVWASLVSWEGWRHLGSSVGGTAGDPPLSPDVSAYQCWRTEHIRPCLPCWPNRKHNSLFLPCSLLLAKERATSFKTLKYIGCNQCINVTRQIPFLDLGIT